MQISITKTVNAEDNTSGVFISLSNQTGKRHISESDFFPDDSEIEILVGRLKKLLTQHFNTVDNGPPV